MLSIRIHSAAYVILAAGPAMADVCVTCSGPATTYACSVKKAEEIEAFAGAKALNKICTKVLKRKGQHASCQVVEPSACPGATATTIGWKEVKEALASKDDTSDPVPSAKPSPPAPPKAADAKPVPDDKAAVATPPLPSQPEEPVQKDPSLGDNIKGAAEKTWKCVSSFFGQC